MPTNESSKINSWKQGSHFTRWNLLLTNLIILISIQLFVDVVISLKKIGAKDK